MRYSRTIGTAGLLAALHVPMGQAVEISQQDPPHIVPVADDGVQRTIVTLDSYSYSPNHLVVEVGEPVELTLTSATTITPHNFIINYPSAGFSIEQEVGAGKTVMLTFTPTHSGIFLIYCDKRLWPMPSHRDKGMEGILKVR